MKNFIKVLAFIFSALLIISCDPNPDANGDLLNGLGGAGNGSGNGGNPTSNKVLSKIISVDDNGIPFTANYLYSSSKLTEITTTNNSFSYTITYNSNNLVSKIVKTENDSGQIIKTTLNATYVSGVLTKATGEQTVDGNLLYEITNDYVYNVGKITSIKTTMTNSGQTYGTIKSTMVYTGSNISNWYFVTEMSPIGPITIPPIEIISVLSNYDTKKNPFSTLPYTFSLLNAHLESETSGISGFNTNNYGSVKITTNAQTQTANYTYIYDADAFPTSFSANGETIKFEYKTL